MKVNKNLLLKILATSFTHNNSLVESFEYLYRFKIITTKEFEDINMIFKDSASLSKILAYLKIDQSLIEFILFFNNYYTLSESIEISLVISEERKNLKKDLISSLIYPFILVILSTISIYFVSNSIVPQLFTLSNENDTTYIIIVYILKYFPLVVFILTLIAFFLIIGILYLLKKDFKKYIYNINKIKYVKDIISYVTSLTFSLYFKEVLKNVPLSKNSIEILQSQTNNIIIQHITCSFIVELDKGAHIFDLINDNEFLSDDLKQTILISKDSSNMSYLLNDYYDFKMTNIKRKLKSFIAVFVPIVISIVGIILVLMYLLIMLPIINMSTSL